MSTSSNNRQSVKPLKKLVVACALVTTGAFIAPVNAGNDAYSVKGELRDAWLDGKLESAYLVNRHLNNFTIDTEVKGSTAHLSGTVQSDVDRELAEQIAYKIDGIESVENDLKVDPKYSTMDKIKDKAEDAGDSFSMWFEDATITSAIKSKLLINSETSGLAVNVDTHHGQVTLTGEVDSSAEKELIETIAENTDGVRDVNNRLTVDQQS